MNAMVQTLKDFSPLKLAAMAGVGVVLIGFFIFIAMRASSPLLSPIYSNLPTEDSGQIVAELEKRSIPYELRADGTQILVPSDQVMRLRLSLAQQGMPSGGSMVGYEIFDRSEAMGTSNFVLNVKMLRALEGELGRTIGSLAQVESARVHLVIPKKELFTRDKQEPTASVILKMRGSTELTKAEIAAVSHLVATAVPGLKANRITVVDNKGRMLAKGVSDDSDASALVGDSEEFRVGYENRVKNTIESLLERTVGQGKVKAQVTADIDFDRIVTNSETFDPNSQVARSVQSGEEKETSSDRDQKDNVSVANNLPDATPSSAGTLSSRNMQRTDETTNFEISKVVENHVKEMGTVNRLSVAVLVDGTYNEDKDGKMVYAARKPEDLKQLESLVKSAVGFDEKRGDKVEVVNLQFPPIDGLNAEESPFEWLKNDMNNIIQTLVFGGVAILVILLIIRPVINRAIESSIESKEAEALNQAALNAPVDAAMLTDQSSGKGLAEEDEEDLINIDRVQGRVKSSSYRKINDLIDKHPDETVTVLRQWLYREA